MKYKLIEAVVLIICSFLIVAVPFLYLQPEDITAVSSGSYTEDGNTIILDAGHGGEDGGAIGVGGIIEKDINLAITLKTGKFLEFLGYDVIYTRTEDKMTCDEGISEQRKRKVSDIKNRLSLIENSNCLCSFSVHQNIFGGDAVGAQVFYGGNNPESKNIAEALQSGISSLLQPENKRVAKQATKDIYILYHSEKPSVLIECGFISDNKEAALLSENSYQNKMAYAIAITSVKYLTEREVQ